MLWRSSYFAFSSARFRSLLIRKAAMGEPMANASNNTTQTSARDANFGVRR